MPDYIPIDCSYYDELEALATLRKEARVFYLSETDKPIKKTAHIKDFFIVDKVEFMLMGDGSKIRLDKIISVNGKERPGNTCKI